jgi:chemotaxis protein CheD
MPIYALDSSAIDGAILRWIIRCIEDEIMEKNQRTAGAVTSMIAVNFSEMKISSNPVETLVAFSIGAGIGITVHDRLGGVGGMLNFILPDSTKANGTDPSKTPFMFADTGTATLIKALSELGVNAENLKVVIAGGAHIMDQTGIFNIGQKNLEALKACLGDYNVKIHHEAVGGIKSRTLCLEIGSGRSIIKTFGEGEEAV